ncbi:MAG: glycosyltransferase family 2 protein [Pseudomonadota bacterium]
MKLNVIIPTYNRSGSLPLTVNSLLACAPATTLTMTLIVVDNNSKDDTKEVVERMMAAHPGRIRYVFEQKQGQPAALNAGIEAADGDLIGFIDDDEQVPEDWLTTVEAAFQDEGVTFVSGRCVPDWKAEAPEWLPVNRKGLVGLLDYGDAPFEMDTLTKGRSFVGGNSVVRTEAARKVGGYSLWLTYGNDAEFGVKLVNAGYKGRYVPALKIVHEIPADRLTKKYVRKRAMLNHRATVQIRKKWPAIDKLFLGFPIKIAYYKVRKMIGLSAGAIAGKGGPQEKFELELLIWDMIGLFRGWAHFNGARNLGVMR